MTPRFPLAGAVLAVALMAAPLAQAVTFTFTGGDDFVLHSDFDPFPSVPGLTAGSTTVLRNGTLGLSGPGRVTFSYLGTEAGYTNQFLAGGAQLFDNKLASNPSVTAVFGAGPLDFAFRTADPAQTVANGAASDFYGSIALFKASDSSVYALFNDSATSDQDFDDAVVRMDVAPIPLPAAAWLLLAGLGGLGLVKRRATVAAAA